MTHSTRFQDIKNGGDFSFYMNFIKTCPTERKLPKPFLIDYDALQEYPAFYTLPPKLWLGFGINTEDILKYYRDKRSEFPELPPVTRAPPVVELYEEQEVIDILKRELRVLEEQEKLTWFYDIEEPRLWTYTRDSCRPRIQCHSICWDRMEATHRSPETERFHQTPTLIIVTPRPNSSCYIIVALKLTWVLGA
ncbi:hypothetical protein EV361DRAFT_868805 [Lentinula raphanica]|nr:hypothetical protein EV361DRAFT_868805 [Lentinula raphanica]